MVAKARETHKPAWDFQIRLASNEKQTHINISVTRLPPPRKPNFNPKRASATGALPLIINIIEVRKYIQLCNLIIILSSTLSTGSLIFQTIRNYTLGCAYNTLERCNINEHLLSTFLPLGKYSRQKISLISPPLHLFIFLLRTLFVLSNYHFPARKWKFVSSSPNWVLYENHLLSLIMLSRCFHALITSTSNENSPRSFTVSLGSSRRCRKLSFN